jgi:hypothetical protein
MRRTIGRRGQLQGNEHTFPSKKAVEFLTYAAQHWEHTTNPEGVRNDIGISPVEHKHIPGFRSGEDRLNCVENENPIHCKRLSVWNCVKIVVLTDDLQENGIFAVGIVIQICFRRICEFLYCLPLKTSLHSWTINVPWSIQSRISPMSCKLN